MIEDYRERIDNAYGKMMDMYIKEDVCIGDLLAVTKVSEIGDLTFEDVFILSTKLMKKCDGDAFYRRISTNPSGDIQEFDNEDEWFSINHKVIFAE